MRTAVEVGRALEGSRAQEGRRPFDGDQSVEIRIPVDLQRDAAVRIFRGNADPLSEGRRAFHATTATERGALDAVSIGRRDAADAGCARMSAAEHADARAGALPMHPRSIGRPTDSANTIAARRAAGADDAVTGAGAVALHADAVGCAAGAVNAGAVRSA